MRFWPEDRNAQLCGAAVCLVLFFLQARELWLSNQPDDLAFFCFIPLVVGLICAVSYWRRYWELAPEGLIRSTLFRRHIVPYGDIVRIAFRTRYRKGGPVRGGEIEYTRNSSTRRFRAEPLEFELFFDTLRERAVYASLDGWPLPTPAPPPIRRGPPRVVLPERLAKFARKPLQLPKL
jgi:hypothetical protein